MPDIRQGGTARESFSSPGSSSRLQPVTGLQPSVTKWRSGPSLNIFRHFSFLYTGAEQKYLRTTRQASHAQAKLISSIFHCILQQQKVIEILHYWYFQLHLFSLPELNGLAGCSNMRTKASSPISALRPATLGFCFLWELL